MKKFAFFLVLLLLLGAGQASAFVCSESHNVGQSSDNCWTWVQVASNETSLVSNGTVLVYDVANAQVAAKNSAYQVRYSAASANGIYVAGVAQQSIASGGSALVLVRGIGDLAINNQDTIASGGVLFVGVSGNSTVATSTTQTQLGFALEANTVTGGTPARTTKKAYITII